ncbi:tripartite tricarboxylate transporter TctB family protein [Paracoccus sp. (in: a-proteobacteria)]|uniref:tripartite tricarboxylate transporter TctB family protein n=1 Tax=Paracoccus sp. TaxID=267 RepID=UPI003A87A3AE
MSGKRQSEMIGGMSLVVFGTAVAFYALANYQLGTLRQIGPGFLPVVLGAALAVLGLMIAWVARPAQIAGVRRIRPGNVAAITASVIAFALLIERAGYVAAVFATVLIATQPWDRGGWPLRMSIAAAAAGFVGLIFDMGLGMSIHAFPG